MSDSYDYKSRDGVRPISWEVFYGLCKGLARAVAAYKPDLIVGIARGGLYPATQLAHLLQTELYTVRLSRRVNDQVVSGGPTWIQRPNEYVQGKRILLVDEISDTGATLKIVKQELEALGAAEIRTATLYAHLQSSDQCDYVGIVSDELLLNPWDREVLRGGAFVLHPEYADALNKQTADDLSDFMMHIEAIDPNRKH